MSPTQAMVLDGGSVGHEAASMLVAIVVVNYNGRADTFRCLDSLARLRHDGCLTVVVDNGSTPDDSQAIEETYPWVRVIRREDNGGWAGGNNTGIQAALDDGAGWVILLNNDTVVSPELVDRMLAVAARHEEYGVLGPVINAMDEPSEVMTDGCMFNAPGYNGFFQRKAIPLTGPDDEPGVTEVDIVNGCCMMISARVFEQIGLVDERFFLIHEESDFCLRAREAGYRCGVMSETLVWHKGSSSFKRQGNRLQRYFDARNLHLLVRKHSSSHEGGKSPFRSRWQYLKYVYYRYAIEREHGHSEAADAVLEGVCDALQGRFGGYARVRRPCVPVLRGVFEAVRRWKGDQRVQLT